MNTVPSDAQDVSDKNQAAILKRGMVFCCSRNSYTVKTDDGAVLECNIKGKILKNQESVYNPLAPGDIVMAMADAIHSG
ncbi:MAG: hypothetical protein FWF29_05015, partial [Treponema sp.]|nr:hypothetical protein [Treponema sp.]